jgi:hypothetical protein
LNRGRPPWRRRGRSDARYTRDLYRDNGPQHSQSENHTSHDLSCLVLATSHSHAHVSRANTTARRESPQPMPRGSSMPRTESARVHMQGAGRVRRCSLFAPRAPLIHPMTSASSTHAVSRVLRPCRCHSCLPGISLVFPSYFPRIYLVSLFRFLADAASFRAGRGSGRGCDRGHGCGRARDHAGLPPRHGSHSCREHSRTCFRVRDHEASGLRALPLPDYHSP